jgi:glutathione transport system ATP-binding protein
MKDSSLPRPFSVPDPDAPDRPPSEPPIHDTARYTKPLVSVSNLVVGFDVRKDFFGRTTQRLHAVEKVSFDIYPGETLALVGESGSGKSTIGRTIQQLQVASSGDFSFEGRSFSSMAAEERRRLQRRIQYIFQDPFASLDPRKTVGFSIAEPIRTHRIIEDKEAIRERVAELLERVGLEAKSSSCYPHEFSGGQRQRICIARALASEPSLIVADEALTAMDVSIQAQIVNLFMELQRERRLSYLFISHDMAVMERISHRVAVLYLGQIVELGSRAQVFGNPLHPYTKSLLAAVPVPDPSRRVERPFMEREMSTSVFRVGEKPRHVRLEERERGHFVGIED